MANPPSRRSKAVNPAQLLSLFVAFVLVAATGGVLTAGLVMPAVTAVGATANASTELFDDLPEDLGSEEVSEQSRMYAADGTLLTTYYAQNRIVVPLEEISPHMVDAVVAIEDNRFYEHGGIDPEGLMRAAVTNLTSNQVQGGSTLTQQYVKNVLLEAGQIAADPEAIEAAHAPTLGRKLREAKLAIALERVRTKDEIMEGYLNIAQFGPSQYGVQVASQFYFNKDAADLNIGESALLARVTQNPARWNPAANPDNAEVGRNVVLGEMFRYGKITQEEFDEAREIPVEDMLDITPTPTGCGAAGNAAYFCDYVTSIITNNPAFGETDAERRQLLLRGGLEIHTTIDLDMQDDAHQTVMDTVPADDPSGVTSTITSIEPGTGEVKSMAQNTEWGSPEEDSVRNTEMNFNVDHAFGGGDGFQGGSTFKVYVLAEWLRQGNTLADRVDASQGQSFPRNTWNFSCAPDVANDYEPGNIEGIGSGRMTIQDVTTQSVNTAFVNMANQMDVCDIDELARSTGLHVGNGTAPDGRPLELTPSMVLGANYIAPLTMAASFATFASGGTYCEPVAITSITDADGEDVPVPESTCEQVLESDVVNGMNHALQQVLSNPRGTASNGALSGRPAAGKTGTSNDNTSTWFVGYVPQLSTAAWVGHTEGTIPMVGTTINGRYYPRVYSSLLAVPMWQTYMAQVTDDMSVEDFPEAEERQIHGDRVSVPNVTGWSIDGATRYLEAEGFEVQVGDPMEHPWAEDGDVASTEPVSGSRVPPDSTITLRPTQSADDDEDDDDNGNDDGDTDSASQGSNADATARGPGADRGEGRSGWEDHSSNRGGSDDNRGSNGLGRGGGRGGG